MKLCVLASVAVALLGPPQPGARVVILGTGTPNADPDRSGPSVAIVVGNDAYIVDAGPGVVRRAALAARTDSIPALGAAHLRRLFLTHLHSDHTAGLPDLMLTPWVLGRVGPLEIYGPPGTARMVGLLTKAYSEDIEIRLHGGEPGNKTTPVAVPHDVQPGVVYRDANVTVSAFAVHHGKWAHAYGYVFQTRNRKIVVSGDTRPSEAVVTACNGCDVLVHEVYSAERFKARPADWRAYHSSYHTSTYELGDIAMKARPTLLVLYHQLFWGDDDEALLRQVRTRYSGVVVSAHDLGVY